MLLALGACATSPHLGEHWPAGAPATIELTATPFFPQQEYQCGPAALATLLGASGHPVSPDDLVSEVYIPDRQGSLQPEIVAAARKRGLIIYPLRPTLADLTGQLSAGLPVLVLQNLGIPQLPVWHYAVVIGASRDPEALLLRSGTTRRRVEQAAAFTRRWSLAAYWGIVALQPGQLPFNPDWSVYLAAVADLEAGGALEAAGTAYQAALAKAPELTAARLGLANVRYASGDLAAAARLYQALSADSQFGIAALNNLANLQLDQGCVTAAAGSLAEAESRLEPGHALAAALASTKARITAAQRQPAQDHCTATPDV